MNMKRIIFMCLVALMGIGYADAQAPKKSKKNIVTTVFVTDIDCAGCAKKVNDTIPYEKGVQEVSVDVDSKTVTITYNAAKTNDETLVKAFSKIKINAEPMKECCADCKHEGAAAETKSEGDCCGGHDHGHDHSHDHGHNHAH